MHSLLHILEQRRRSQQANVMGFVDFASAFDSVNRDSLRWIMTADGMPTKVLRLIVLRVHQHEGHMKWGDSMSFEIRSGVQQGYALFPTLFICIIEVDSSPSPVRLPRDSGWNQRPLA